MDDMELKNKTIVLTGASRGLGKEIAIKLAHENARLILIARSMDELLLVQKEIQKTTCNIPVIKSCDISVEQDVKSLSEFIGSRFETIDILINNAAIGIHRESETICNSDMKKLFEVNFFGQFYLIKSLLPLIKQSKCGYILNVGSLVSKVSFSYNSLYAATKSALAGFTQGLRLELKKYQIKVGIIHPGLMNTSFQTQETDRSGKLPSILFLKPDKIANSCIRMIKKRQTIKYHSKPILWLLQLKYLTYLLKSGKDK